MFRIPYLKSGDIQTRRPHDLTGATYIQFEIMHESKYRFYEYLEPSYYRFIDINSANVYNFLKFFDKQMEIELYDPGDQFFIYPRTKKSGV